MKLKTGVLIVLLITGFALPGYCCDCDPPCTGDCAECVGGECVPGTGCENLGDCYDECIMISDTRGECWACGLSGKCCGGSCCSSGECCGPYGQGCCPLGEKCCNYECTANVCCNSTRCESNQYCCSYLHCCDNGNACCDGECCDPGEQCCGPNKCCEECCHGSVYCCSFAGTTCCEENQCYDPSTLKCCEDGAGTICGINEVCCNGGCHPEGRVCCNNSICPEGYECCDGLNCYNPATQQCCEDGTGRLCDIDKQCCDDGTCQEDGCCWSLELLPTETQGGFCSCIDSQCVGLYNILDNCHTCVRSSSGYKNCGLVDNVQIGVHFGCTKGTNLAGVIACYMLNLDWCMVLCDAAIVTCVPRPGYDPDACHLALRDCYYCLVSEGFDCGCLVVSCSLWEEPTPLYGTDYRCSGESCE